MADMLSIPFSKPYECPNADLTKRADLETMAAYLRQSPRFAGFIRSKIILALGPPGQVATDAQACLKSYCKPSGDEIDLYGLPTEDDPEVPNGVRAKCTEHAALLVTLANRF